MKDYPEESIYFQDELRYGTRTESGRRWLPFGERPRCPIKIGYDFGLLYMAICPYNGNLVASFLPDMKKQCFEIFCKEVHKEAEHKPIVMVLDRASSHTSAQVSEDIKLIFLPPACPELNPVERFFKEIRKELKLRVFQSLELLEQKIQKVLKKYFENPQIVISITKFDYINIT